MIKFDNKYIFNENVQELNSRVVDQPSSSLLNLGNLKKNMLYYLPFTKIP